MTSKSEPSENLNLSFLALYYAVGVCEAAGKLLQNRLNMPSEIASRSVEAKNGCATRRARRETGLGLELEAMREKLVIRGVIYTMICEEDEDRVVGGIKLAERRRGKKMRER